MAQAGSERVESFLIGPKLQRKWWRYTGRQLMVTIDLNELNLKPHDVVLDAGCGLGRHLRHLARMPELKIFGIDKNTWAD